MSPRPAKFRFLYDENFPAHAGEFLSSLSHNVISTPEDMRSKDDNALLKYASKENRILLTQDSDFKSYTFSQENIAESLGVVVFVTNVSTTKQFERMCNKLLSNVTPTQLKGKVCRCSVNKVSLHEPSDYFSGKK